MSWGKGILAAPATALAVAAALALPSSAPAACPEEYDYCGTADPDGTYVLRVPSFSFLALIYPELKALEDCVWRVEVDFGDGSPNEIYELDAAVGLTGAHRFPAPGTYVVLVHAREGEHAKSGEPCPDFDQTAAIAYPEPPPSEPEPPPAGDPPGGTPSEPLQPTGPDPAAGGSLEPPTAVGAVPAAQAPARTQRSKRFWRRCAGGRLLAHRVRCRRALLVTRQAAARAWRGRARVGGFRCRLAQPRPWRIRCRRGARRILR